MSWIRNTALYDSNMNDSVAKSFPSWNRDKGPEFWFALIKFLHILLGCMESLALYDSNMNYSVAKSFTSGNRDKGPEFWLALIKRIFIDTPKYVVKGIPSLAKQQEDTRLGLITFLLEALGSSLLYAVQLKAGFFFFKGL